MSSGFLHEYFGNKEQQELQRRAVALFHVLKDNPAYSSHGRTVAVAGYGEDPDIQEALARLQGVAPCDPVLNEHAETLKQALTGRGLVLDVYNNWSGGESVHAAALNILQERNLPKDLSVRIADDNTPAVEMQRIAETTQSCGVLLPAGCFMRGLMRPAVCVYAVDTAGHVAGTAAAVAHNHPDHERAKEAWWGMLATREDRRGRGIAMILGAMAIDLMHDRHGMTGFVTGIREGNVASEHVCSRLGLSKSTDTAILAIEPNVFGSGQMTK